MTSIERAVIDASVAIKWVINELQSEAAVRLLDRGLLAPDLLCVEYANILWKKVTRGELAPDEADAAAQSLEGAEIEFVASRPYLAAATRIAVELDHPAYDCLYLAVAEDADVPMVSADHRLIRKVRSSAARFRDRVVALSDVA
jgi:predicted nucleic acid-binding protein